MNSLRIILNSADDNCVALIETGAGTHIIAANITLRFGNTRQTLKYD